MFSMEKGRYSFFGKTILVTLLVLISQCVQAYDWERNDHSWHTGDYNGDNLEDLILKLDPLMIPIMMDYILIASVEQPQYVFLRQENGSFVKQIVSLSQLENVSTSPVSEHRIIMDDHNGDGTKDITVSVGHAGEEQVVLYGTNTENVNIDFQISVDDRSTSFEGETLVGALKGNLDVSNTGAATYTIPLSTPPGINGVKPKLALSYNSQSGRGIAGRGWNLESTSIISRCKKNYLQDNILAGIKFDSSDVYCLDGKRLEPVPGTSNDLRFKVGDKTKIEFSGPAHNPSGFKVYKKNGLTYVYGYSDNAIHKRTTGDLSFAWYLHKIENHEGVSVNYNYDNRSASGIMRLLSIGYGVVNITFDYETVSDPRTTFIAPGVKSYQDSRLKSLKFSPVTTNLPSYWYNLTYDNNSAFNSILSQISYCTSGGCENPTRIEWSDAIDAFHPQDDSFSTTLPDLYFSAENGRNLGTVLTDMNSDGKSDLLQLYRTTDYEYQGVHQKRLLLSDGASFYDASSQLDWQYFGWISYGDGVWKDGGIRINDVTGDAFPDFIYAGDSTTAVYGYRHFFTVRENTGGGFPRLDSYSGENGPDITYRSSYDQQNRGAKNIDVRWSSFFVHNSRILIPVHG